MLALIVALAAAALLAQFSTRHFQSARAGSVSLALFLTMPVVWLAALEAAPQLMLLPLLMAWLIAIAAYDRTANPRWLLMAGAALGAMPLVHLMGLVLAPAYGVVTLTVLIARRHAFGAAFGFLAGAAVIGLPWLLWAMREPEWYSLAVAKYGLYDAQRFNILQGGREIASWVGLTVRSEVYWDSFDPALLFLGKGGVTETLLRSEMFLLPFAIPLVMGLAGYARGTMRLTDWAVLGAFLVAPVAVALLAQPPVPARLLLMAPAAAIIAARPFVRPAAGSPLPARR